MKIITAVIMMFFCPLLLTAQETRTGDVLLPEIRLSISDESEVPLRSETNSLFRDEDTNRSRINMEELARARTVEKLRVEFNEEKQKDNVSMSSVRVSYGMYDNLLSGVYLGNRTGDINYIFSYLRNRRGSLAHDTNQYFNTELQIDNLYANAVYTLSNNLMLSLQVGYNVRDNGLWNNTSFITESRTSIPILASVAYSKDAVENFRMEMGYDYFSLVHKSQTLYERTGLWDGYLGFRYEWDFSRDNFIKLKGQYQFSDVNTIYQHSGLLGALFKFPWTAAFAFELGGDVFFYTYKDFFWYPTAVLTLKQGPAFNMKLGITGKQEYLSSDRLESEDQVDFETNMPAEKWSGFVQLQFSPLRSVSMKGRVSYDYHMSYLNYTLNSQSLYALLPLTNVGSIEAEALLEFLPLDNQTNSLSFNLSYRYHMADRTGLLLEPLHEAVLMADYKHYIWGTELSTRLTYRDSYNLSTTLVAGSSILWDITLSQQIGKNLVAEAAFENILNQDIIRRLSAPEGGFRFSAGFKVLI